MTSKKFKVTKGKIYIYKSFFDLVSEEILFTKYTSLKKIFNLALILLQNFLFRGTRVFGYPIRLTIEPTTYCNLKCPLCPTGRGDSSRSKGVLKFEDFKKIIDEVGDYVFSISFFNWGEPFINKEIFDMIRYANGKRIQTKVSTNLTIFNEEIARKIVESGLDILIASIDGASADTYSKYRVGADFEKVINNLKTLIEVKKKLNRRNPKIIWQFVIMKHNEHEIDKVVKMARDMGVKLKLTPTRVDMGKELTDEIKKYEDWFPSEEYSRYIDGKKVVKLKRCLFLWTQCVINWDGNLLGCCAMYPEEHDFGNIFKEGGLLKSWNNEKFRFARFIIKHKIFDENIICSSCLKNGFVEPN